MKRQKVQFIDIETTHLNKKVGEIIEIAILTSFDNGKTIATQWSTRIKPDHIETADTKALEINNYCPFIWNEAPKWIYSWSKIIDQIDKNAIIVAHNILFDASWIEEKVGKEIEWSFPRKKICTQTLALEHLPTAPSVSLSYLRKLFKLSNILAHTAMKDTKDCWIIFNKLNQATALKRLWWRFKIWKLK